ncbi:MAG: bifunctional acetate--CoA ligase family protein/GNAT family N-acetyltransferase, partial [Chromatiales bacterium]
RVFSNLIAGKFKGSLYAVNPKHKRVQRRKSYATVEAIGKPVDLAVIATPARTVPPIVHQCGEAGVKSIVVPSAGFKEAGSQGVHLQEALMEEARRYRMRVLGPNCLGIMRPDIGLNATFSNNIADAGNLALVSQSGALCTAMLDWAQKHGIGFSSVVSLGDVADLDFGEVLDYLAMDGKTRAILLYIEGIRDARNFMSGLRAAARLKPIIVMKAGRFAEGSRAVLSHTGALVGADDIFNAAMERAGAVRVMDIGQLFSAARILSTSLNVRNGRLAIVTNGGGPGVLATDRAVELELNVPEPGTDTMTRLNEILPAHWSGGNPIDILGDAPPERYREAVEACLKDRNFDGVLAILTPQAMTQPTEAAQAVIDASSKTRKPVLTCWMGESQVMEARELFDENRLPSFHMPEYGVAAFAHLASYQRNQQLLMQVPEPVENRSLPDVDGARLIIEGVLQEGRHVLTAIESKAVLRAFHIPVAPTIEAHTSGQALVAAQSLGFPVAMKISSPELTHKSDVGGVRLNVANAQAVRSVFNQMMEEISRQHPEANISGITIEPMYKGPNGRELMVGVVRDPVFGPVISFGSGGTAVEVHRDRAVALPPLNSFIIGRTIQRTRVAKLLGPFRQMPAVSMEALEQVLLRVSDLVCELAEIHELDINPLIADEDGVMAIDARISVAYPPAAAGRYSHMAIHPYPAHLITHMQLSDGTDITIRPIRPEDADIEQKFVRGLSEEAKYFRFMQALQELTPEMLVRFTQIDYHREMALIAVTELDGEEVELAVARYTTNPDGESCEFGIVVADAWHGRGIGAQLMHALMETARSRGLRLIEGEVLARNRNMLKMVTKMGFSVHESDEDSTIKVVRRPL